MNTITMPHKTLSGISDLITIHILNGSVLFYLKQFTFDSIMLVIKSNQVTGPADILIWVTIIYTVVKTIYLISQWKCWITLTKWLKKSAPKVKLFSIKTLKSIYGKLDKKFFREHQSQDKQ